MLAVVIVNPASGTAAPAGSMRDRVALARQVLAAAGVEADVQTTARPGHAFELAQAAIARGAGLVYAWGGDGTINEVARALAFGPVPLGVVPAGSGNGFARELGIPFDPTDALRSALRVPDRQIDAGQIGGRLFFNIAGIGLDAHVSARLAARPAGRRGLLGYVTHTARALLAYEPRSYTIVSEQQTFTRRALIIALANLRQYGHGARIAPRAQPDDGLLDLVVIEPGSVLGDLSRVRRLFTGTFEQAGGVTTMKVQEVRISAEAPMAFHVDGELVSGEQTLTAQVHPRALRVRA